MADTAAKIASRMGQPLWQRVPTSLVYLIGAIPGVWTFYLGLSDQLGADPLKVLERSLGFWSLRFLMIGLAITPLRRYANINLLRYRRSIGLLAFFYALSHLTVYLWLDQGLDATLIFKDIVKRPYITIGMVAFLILLPLALTSNNAMIKRLGATWQRLHKWVYVAAALAALHLLMLVKTITLEPAIYAALVASLLALRLLPKPDRRRQPA